MTANVLLFRTVGGTTRANFGCSSTRVNAIVIGWLLMRLHATIDNPAGTHTWAWTHIGIRNHMHSHVRARTHTKTYAHAFIRTGTRVEETGVQIEGRRKEEEGGRRKEEGGRRPIGMDELSHYTAAAYIL